MAISLRLDFLHTFNRRIKALKPRERLALFVVGIMLAVLLWDQLIMQGLGRRNNTAAASLATLDVATDTDTAVAPEIAAVADLLQRAESLKAEQSAMLGELRKQSVAYVDAADMVALVRDLLKQRKDLKLVRLATLEPEELIGAPDATQAADGNAESIADAGSTDDGAVTVAEPAVAYVHGMELTVKGSFQQVHEYVSALEHQDWHLLWQGLEIDTDQYPLLKARIRLATINVDRHWSGAPT